MKLLQIAISIWIFMVLCHSTETVEVEQKFANILKEHIEKVDERKKIFESNMNELQKRIYTISHHLDSLYVDPNCSDTIESRTEKEDINENLKTAILNLSTTQSNNKDAIEKLQKEKEDIENLKNLHEDAIKNLKKENDASVDSIKNLKTEIDDSKKLHGEEMNLLKNTKEVEISRLKNEKEVEISRLKNEKEVEISRLKNEAQDEMIKLKTMHDEKMSGVHVNYIIGIIIGAIVILGLNGYFCCCCLKPDKTKVKNENKDLDIEAYGELSLSQIVRAPGMLAATQGEDSISFCMAIGPMPEMLTTEEYEISAQQITEITTGGEKEQKEKENTIMSVDLKYVPKIGEYIVATSNFQAFSVPMGRPRNIKVTDMPMNVHKFNKKGDALVDSERYGTLLFKILKRDFNKIKSSQNKTHTVKDPNNDGKV